ncbi:MAG: hypothetical protein LUC24_00385, partial [Bacteroidales bacterium]|nr:hypothetical protein [Bacteroidales bacterium]
KSPASPQEWYEAGVLLRARERFGEAINAFRQAADLVSDSDGPELQKIKASSLAFIELIDEIRSFVNKDLLNP